MGKLIADKFAAWQEECEQRFQKLKANEEELNRIFIDIYGLQDELTPEVEEKDSKENLCKATKRNLGRFCYAAFCLKSIGDRPLSLSLMRLLLYHSMYS